MHDLFGIADGLIVATIVGLGGLAFHKLRSWLRDVNEATAATRRLVEGQLSRNGGSALVDVAPRIEGKVDRVAADMGDMRDWQQSQDEARARQARRLDGIADEVSDVRSAQERHATEARRVAEQVRPELRKLGVQLPEM